MARWVLECEQCKAEFPHSEISESVNAVLDPFTLIPKKPEFPVGGVTVACPNCKGTAVYQRYELLYRAP